MYNNMITGRVNFVRSLYFREIIIRFASAFHRCAMNLTELRTEHKEHSAFTHRNVRSSENSPLNWIQLDVWIGIVPKPILFVIMCWLPFAVAVAVVVVVVAAAADNDVVFPICFIFIFIFFCISFCRPHNVFDLRRHARNGFRVRRQTTSTATKKEKKRLNKTLDATPHSHTLYPTQYYTSYRLTANKHKLKIHLNFM